VSRLARLDVVSMRLLAVMLLAGCLGTGSTASAAARGEVRAGVAHAAPDWFKVSFLDIGEDAAEAGAADKHLMLFFQLNNCPYCDRMLTECFETEPYMGFIREHFDVIALNVQGDREIAFDERTSLSEKALASLLKVRGTPAILFLDADNKQVARVNGYRSPQRFQQVLNYVSSKAYRDSTLADYLDRNLARDVYRLRANALFSDISDLSTVRGPLALIFEGAGCYDCPEFDGRLLSRADVIEELRKFTVVRLDADSNAPLVDPAGNRTTAHALARKHQVTYRPGVLLFDQGKLIRRHDSLLYSFHFKESLRYVSGGFHKVLSAREFSERYREELLSRGVDVDFTE